MVDVLVVPDRLENAVCKPDHHEVLHSFLAEVVVDPKDLGLVKYSADGGVDLLRGCQIMPDWLFHDDA